MKVILVGEIGINHNGEINIAKNLIDVAVVAGLDYVKFQKRTIDLVYTKEELTGTRESPWGNTFRQQKEGLEFNREGYDEIDRYCKGRGIGWFASPWDVESVEFLKKYDLPYIKVASPMMTNFDLMHEIKLTEKPVIISTGMSTSEEVNEVLDYLYDQVEYILACTSTYPTPLEEVNLNFIRTLKDRAPKYRIGYSNHSPGIFFSAVAAAFGAEMLEFHITLDRAMYGSDQAASVEPGQIMKLVKYVDHLQKALGDGEWQVFPGEKKIKKKLRG